MAQSGAQQMKKETYQTIQNYLKNEAPVEKDRMLAELEIEMGLSQEKASEYIETLEKAKRIKIEDGEVTFLGD